MVSARFVNSVGVAPSTTTMMVPYATPGDMSGRSLHGVLGLIADDTAIRTGRRGQIPGTTTLQVFDNRANVVNQLPGSLFGAELGATSGEGGGWWKWPTAVIFGGILGATVAHFATRKQR